MLVGASRRVGRLNQMVGQVIEGGPGQDLFDPLHGQRVGQPVEHSSSISPFSTTTEVQSGPRR